MFSCMFCSSCEVWASRSSRSTSQTAELPCARRLQDLFGSSRGGVDGWSRWFGGWEVARSIEGDLSSCFQLFSAAFKPSASIGSIHGTLLRARPPSWGTSARYCKPLRIQLLWLAFLMFLALLSAKSCKPRMALHGAIFSAWLLRTCGGSVMPRR